MAFKVIYFFNLENVPVSLQNANKRMPLFCNASVIYHWIIWGKQKFLRFSRYLGFRLKFLFSVKKDTWCMFLLHFDQISANFIQPFFSSTRHWWICATRDFSYVVDFLEFFSEAPNYPRWTKFTEYNLPQGRFNRGKFRRSKLIRGWAPKRKSTVVPLSLLIYSPLTGALWGERLESGGSAPYRAL
jgi:hypothetical protein